MSKNIMLATINPESIEKLSTFALNESEMRKALNRYNEVKDIITAVRKRMLSVVEKRETSRHIATDEIEITRTNRYASNGIHNIPFNIYDSKSERINLETVIDCNEYLDRISGQYANKVYEMRKAYNNAVSGLIPDCLYESYVFGLKAGSYDAFEVGKKSFLANLATMLRRFGFLNAEDSKAVKKFSATIAIFEGGRYSLKKGLTANGRTTFNKILISAMIERLTEKQVIRLTSKGFVKIDRSELVKTA